MSLRQQIHYFTIILISALFCSCSINNGSTSLTGKLFDETKIEVLSKNISIDGSDIASGKEIILKAGEKLIIYNGELLRKELITTDNTNSQNNSMSGVGCFLLFPICILNAAASGLAGEQIYNYIPSSYHARIIVQTEAGHKYVVKTNDNTTDLPLLTVYRKTSPSFTITEKIMTCTDLDKTS